MFQIKIISAEIHLAVPLSVSKMNKSFHKSKSNHSKLLKYARRKRISVSISGKFSGGTGALLKYNSIRIWAHIGKYNI